MTLEPGFMMEFEAGTGLKIGANSAADFWEGLYFSGTSNPLNQLIHLTIDGAGSNSTTGAIAMWARPTLSLSSVEISNVSGGCAIYDNNGLSAGLPSNPNYMSSAVVFKNVNSQYCD